MSSDTNRVSVQTYVSEYQRDIWREEAEEMGMSQAEFVRTMVQAGRNRFDLPPIEDDTDGPTTQEGAADRSSIERRVLDALSNHGPLGWEELVSVLTEGIEAELEETLEDLQAENTVIYSGREGGYTLQEGENGE